MKRLICFAAVLVVAVLAGCAAHEAHVDAQASVGAAPVTVSIDNFTFTPAVVTISPGGKVVWTNRDDVPHIVKANDGSFTSAALDTDQTFAEVFAKRGEYPYFCALHPHMTARVIVK